MPFDEEEEMPTIQSQKIGLKQVSTQKSIFETMPKKPTQAEFTDKVNHFQERQSFNKTKAVYFSSQFKKFMTDKTLSSNKNTFQSELEIDFLRDMINWAQDANENVSEREGEGSLSLITLLLNNAFRQRDKINKLEYSVSQLEKKFDALDKKKNSE